MYTLNQLIAVSGLTLNSIVHATVDQLMLLELGDWLPGAAGRDEDIIQTGSRSVTSKRCCAIADGPGR